MMLAIMVIHTLESIQTNQLVVRRVPTVVTLITDTTTSWRIAIVSNTDVL